MLPEYKAEKCEGEESETEDVKGGLEADVVSESAGEKGHDGGAKAKCGDVECTGYFWDTVCEGGEGVSGFFVDFGEEQGDCNRPAEARENESD